MSAYLINHLRIPGGVPNEEGLSYPEQVESTVKAYGGRWLAQGESKFLKEHGRAQCPAPPVTDGRERTSTKV